MMTQNEARGVKIVFKFGILLVSALLYLGHRMLPFPSVFGCRSMHPLTPPGSHDAHHAIDVPALGKMQTDNYYIFQTAKIYRDPNINTNSSLLPRHRTLIGFTTCVVRFAAAAGMGTADVICCFPHYGKYKINS